MQEDVAQMIRTEMRVLCHAIIIAQLVPHKQMAILDAGPIAAKIYDAARKAAGEGS